MSVIQTIREKYATLMVVVVCISLVAFLLMDALVGPKSFFHQNTEVGSVNGQGMDIRDFTAEVQQQENLFRMQNPDRPANDETRHQVREQVWNKFIQDNLLGAEYEKLGIGFSPEELHDLTLTTNADPQIKAIPAFKNPQTGEFDPNRVASFWQSLKNAPADNQQAAQQRAQWLQIEDYLQNSSKARKFSSLITKALYIPSWLSKEKEAERNTYATISYVSVDYTSIPDSSIKLTDAELQQYIDNHSALYQRDPSRSIEYVSFNAIPSAQDTAAIMKQMNGMIAAIDTIPADDVPGFISRNSETKYYDGFIPGSMIQSSEKDSLLLLPVGGALGPYYDNGSVVFAKMIAKKTIPDTVEMKQLLISTQLHPDTTAKRRIDSLENAVKAGANFDQLVAEFSDGSKEEGGKIVLTPGNPNIPEDMNHFAFNQRTGDIDVVKSEYGYHLVKIIDQKHFEPAYKIAYLTRHMDPSQQTDNATFSEASRFAGVNTTRAAFEKSTSGQDGLNRLKADIKPTDYDVQNIGPARELIQWAYKAEVGDVSGVFSLGNKYVIAVLTGIQEKGTADLASVRPQVEAIVRRDKKAALIAEKMKGNTLQEVAKSVNDSISQAQHIGMVTPFIPNAGFEPKVVGAAFNPALKSGDKLSSPIYGNNGVYVLKVDSLQTETPEAEGEQYAKQQEMMLQQQVGSQLIEMLKKDAEIEDHRLKFF